MRIAFRVLAAGVACLALEAPPGLAQQAPRGLRIIVVDNEAEADRLAAEIRDGASFPALAARHSTDPSALRQGILGRFAIGDLRADYRGALAGLDAGAVSAPFPVVDGFALLQWMTPEDEAWVARRDQGIRAAGEGRYDDAERVFEAALGDAEAAGVADLRLGESLGDLAELRRLQGRGSDALPLLARALSVQEPLLGASHPMLAPLVNDLAELHRRQGDLEESRGRYAEAEGHRRRSLDILDRTSEPRDPARLRTMENLARLLRLQDRAQESIAVYRTVLFLRWGDPGMDDPQSLPGLLEALMEVLASSVTNPATPDAGVRLLADGISRTPLMERFPVAAGRILITAGLTSAAEQVLEAAAGQFPASRVIQYERAELALRLGRFETALRDYRRAREILGDEPPEAWIDARIGDAQMELSRGHDALDAYLRASALDADNAEVRVRIGNAHADLGNHEQALVDYGRAVELDPGLATAHSGVAESSLRLNRFDAVVDAAGQALALGGADRRMWYLQGLALLRAGRGEAGRDALAEYERLSAGARRREARLVETVVAARRAVEAHDAGDGARAVELLEGAVRAAPDAHRLTLTLGLVLLETGRHADAVGTFQRMIDAGLGNDSLVQWSLARAHREAGDTAAADRHEALFLERMLVDLEANSNGR